MVLLQIVMQWKWHATVKQLEREYRIKELTKEGSEFGKTQVIQRALMKDAGFREDSRRSLNLRHKKYGIRWPNTMSDAKDNRVLHGW